MSLVVKLVKFVFGPKTSVESQQHKASQLRAIRSLNATFNQSPHARCCYAAIIAAFTRHEL